MKVMIIVSVLLVALGIAVFFTTEKTDITVIEKASMCTLWECSYEVTVKNTTTITQSAYFQVTGVTSATQYRQARKVEETHDLDLRAGETQIIKGQITIPVARSVFINILNKN